MSLPDGAADLASGRYAVTMIAMTSTDLSGVPADVAAVGSSIENEIAGWTLLTAYAETVARAPDVVAHQWLAGGGWRSLTYRQVYERVRDAGLGLAATGLGHGKFAAVWSRNRRRRRSPTTRSCTPAGSPCSSTRRSPPDQAADMIGHCEATVVIIEPEFLPVLDSIRGGLPQLRALVVLGRRRPRGRRTAPPRGRTRHCRLAGTA